ncbi:hypothetical protein IF690_17110 [Pseudomonas sp. SK3(2021)]|uniref:hypothetical protein n=1 Tax=Pseudomonas sp. SK3(2021) TaxID=2841064 RepID=UPI00192C9C8C|nr:hypothetical protein [Pseudomonas sp. SK3(2021)]QQZ39772.1 hypothetical protein IF690_17110 [Pseudomonas sp. SK3(2021)]
MDNSEMLDVHPVIAELPSATALLALHRSIKKSRATKGRWFKACDPVQICSFVMGYFHPSTGSQLLADAHSPLAQLP